MPEVNIGRAGGAALAMVTADQETILGNGTQLNPLRSSGGGISFIAQYTDDINEPFLGMPVTVTAGTPAFGVACVDAATGGLAAGDVDAPRPYTAGLLTSITEVQVGGGGTLTEVVVQHTGRVELSVPQWLAPTADAGLTPGSVYFLDTAFDSFGLISTFVVSDPGRFRSPVGVALNATTLQLLTPPVPTENP